MGVMVDAARAEWLAGQDNLQRIRQEQKSTLVDGLKPPGTLGLEAGVPTNFKPKLVDRECAICGDPIQHLVTATRPVCLKCHQGEYDSDLHRGWAEEDLRYAGLLDGQAAHMHLRTFETVTPQQERAYQVVTDWLVDWAASMLFGPLEGFGESVLLWSKSPGTGKTHLARAVQRRAIIAGGHPQFISASEMVNKIRQSYDDPRLRADQVLAPLKQCKLLILDDLGKSYVRPESVPWLREILWGLIDHHYKECKPMLVTSNLDPDGVAGLLGLYGASRWTWMVGDRVVDMSGGDWRMRKEADDED